VIREVYQKLDLASVIGCLDLFIFGHSRATGAAVQLAPTNETDDETFRCCSIIQMGYFYLYSPSLGSRLVRPGFPRVAVL
jgi:hypothetical protein